ncbi:hypothetical protein D9758_014949 [Tetrapyrgos nigripes]|uniref:Pheromone receptor n=1 Tax=Tetrapyrgos nigripes TaxID=182062 RepID=A0A8H5CKC2_9AGAR|nr:hypothetical protein D9758_014949 [Tetrapyrgos nigripes]
MAPALPAVSFVLVVLLNLLLVFPAIRKDIVRMSLICWLIFSNIIHGVNAVAWSSNTNIHVPVWCDITTKFLLGAMVALPGALLCLACRLEFVASQRPILFALAPSSGTQAGGETTDSANLATKRLRIAKIKQLLFDLSLCVVFPVVFLFLHFIVENHRFDITADLGCSASIHSSIPGLLITSLPPLLLCIAALIVACQAIHHSFLLPHSGFSQHIASRSQQNPFTETMSSSVFLRRMILILVLIAVMTVFILFTAFNLTTADAFSWQAVHAHMSQIHIVKGGDEQRYTVLVWWEVPVVAIVYFLLEVGIGQDVRDGVRDGVENGKKAIEIWQARRKEKKTKAASENLLPLHRSSSQPNAVVPLSPISSRATTTQDKSYVSGWDDTIKLKSSLKTFKLNSHTPTDSSSSRSTSSPAPTMKPVSLRTDCPRRSASIASRISRISRADGSNSPISVRFPPSPAPAVSPSPAPDRTEDEAFSASTLEYLSSRLRNRWDSSRRLPQFHCQQW